MWFHPPSSYSESCSASTGGTLSNAKSITNTTQRADGCQKSPRDTCIHIHPYTAKKREEQSRVERSSRQVGNSLNKRELSSPSSCSTPLHLDERGGKGNPGATQTHAGRGCPLWFGPSIVGQHRPDSQQANGVSFKVLAYILVFLARQSVEEEACRWCLTDIDWSHRGLGDVMVLV